MRYISPRVNYNDSDIELLARIMKAEALGEGEEGMLMVGNVVINRVVANCDVFKNTRSIPEVIYYKNAFAGVGEPLFNQPVNDKEKELALRNIEGYRIEPAYSALWFKNPGSSSCPSEFFGTLSGRYKRHCFYNPKSNLNCEL